jgi:hypothetical protein
MIQSFVSLSFFRHKLGTPFQILLSILCLLKNVVFCWIREEFVLLCAVYAVMNEFMQINFSIKLIDSFDRHQPIHGHSTRN